MTFLFTMTTNVIVMIPVLFVMLGATAPVTLPSHPSHVGAPIALLLLTLSAGVHLHCVGVFSGRLLRRSVLSAPFLLGFALSHALVEDLSGGFQVVEVGDGAVRDSQVVLELFTEP